MTSLDTIAQNPALADSLSAPAISALLLRLSAVQTLLAARLAGLGGIEGDELLSVEQIAKLVGRHPGSVRNCMKNEPWRSCVRKIGRRVFFSKRAFLASLEAGHGQ